MSTLSQTKLGKGKPTSSWCFDPALAADLHLYILTIPLKAFYTLLVKYKEKNLETYGVDAPPATRKKG